MILQGVDVGPNHSSIRSEWQFECVNLGIERRGGSDIRVRVGVPQVAERIPAKTVAGLLFVRGVRRRDWSVRRQGGSLKVLPQSMTLRLKEGSSWKRVAN